MKFKFLTGDINYLQYGAKWISPKQSNGEFDYWLVMELINMLDATGECPTQGKYHVSLSAVSPSEAGEKNMQSAIKSCGCSEMELNDLTKVELLSSYGVQATLFQNYSNNAKKLLTSARKEASLITSFLFGFRMDNNQNSFGNSGWDFIKGEIGFK